MRVIVLASSNQHKVKEIAAMLPSGIALKTMSEAGFTDLIEETAETIKGNSLIKAVALRDFLRSRNDQSWVIADDSGLEVKALNGAPGVRSARYAAAHATDADNVKKLLGEMQQQTERRARFVTIITLLSEDMPFFFEGEITGSIAHEPRGTNGFGYDPVFIPTGYRSTFAELSANEKNAISHRALAVDKLAKHLRAIL